MPIIKYHCPKCDAQFSSVEECVSHEKEHSIQIICQRLNSKENLIDCTCKIIELSEDRFEFQFSWNSNKRNITQRYIIAKADIMKLPILNINIQGVTRLISSDCGKANTLGTDYVPEPTNVFSPAMEKVIEQNSE